MKKSDGPNDEKPMSNEGDRSQDVVLVQGVTEDRQGLRVLRARDQQIEAGEVRPLKEGQAITSDVVKLHPRPGIPFLCDVETTYSPTHAPSRAATHSKGPASATSSSPSLSKRLTTAGPAQVASQTYRENWDAIWAKHPFGKSSSELN